MRITSLILLTTLLLTTSGCSRPPHKSIDSALAQETLTLHVTGNGSPESVLMVPNDAPLVTTLRAFIADPNRSWKSSYATYAQLQVLRGQSFSIYVFDNALVVNHTAPDGGSRQLSTSLTTDESEQLRREIQQLIGN